jgi:methionine aminopeptidase
MLNIPVLRTLEEIALYREVGPKFGQALKDTAEFIQTSKSDLPYGAINECFGETANALIGSEVLFPFRDERNHLGDRFHGLACVSANNCVAHGRDSVKLGNIVSIDAGISVPCNGRTLYFDAAITVVCGESEPDAETQALVQAPLQALKIIKNLKNLKNVLEMTAVIEAVAQKEHFDIMASVSGHGIGYSLHEAPVIPNMMAPAASAPILPKTCFCPEPMYVEQRERGAVNAATAWLQRDAWAIYTTGRTSHWETTFYFDGSELEDIVGITNAA